MVKYWAAALFVCTLFAASCSSGSGSGAEVTTEPPATVAPTLPAGEHTEVFQRVDARAAGSRDGTFSVTYDFYAPDLVGGDSGTLTVAQDLPMRSTRFVNDGSSRGVAFVGADPDLTACGMTVGEWHCYSAKGYFEQAPAVLDYGDLLAVLDTLRANQRWFSWAQDTRELAGTSADCAVGTATSPDAMEPDLQRRVGTKATVCVAATGVPLLVEFSREDGSELLFRAQASSYDNDVAAASFDPPAPVEAGPPNVAIPVPQPPGGSRDDGQGTPGQGN